MRSQNHSRSSVGKRIIISLTQYLHFSAFPSSGKPAIAANHTVEGGGRVCGGGMHFLPSLFMPVRPPAVTVRGWSKTGMASSSKATLILLIYGILMHYSVFCTPIGLGYPKISDQIAIRSPPSVDDDAYSLYYPQEQRPERHAEEELDRALREILGQLTARHYRHFLMTIRGKDSSAEEDSEPLSKRHSDGIFTDSYSRYRKQMAVQKYLAAVLGRRYRQRVRNKGRRLAYL
eukprot:XP_011614553.1 PREDICTED: GHRH/PACAP precursor isoform X3 [Takifugu rubripes]